MSEHVKNGDISRRPNLKLVFSDLIYGLSLNIVAFNQKGEDSEEVILQLKLNSPSTISSTSTLSGEILSEEKEITWLSSDLNDDAYIYQDQCSLKLWGILCGA